MSNSSDPDQDRLVVDSDLGSTVYKGYQQKTKVAASKAGVNCVFCALM